MRHLLLLCVVGCGSSFEPFDAEKPPTSAGFEWNVTGHRKSPSLEGVTAKGATVEKLVSFGRGWVMLVADVKADRSWLVETDEYGRPRGVSAIAAPGTPRALMVTDEGSVLGAVTQASTGQSAIFRFTSGALDLSWGDGGVLRVGAHVVDLRGQKSGGRARVFALLDGPDGRLEQYDSNGSLERSQRIPFQGLAHTRSSMVISGDGILLGTTIRSSGDEAAAFARVLPSGLDDTFGRKGIFTSSAKEYVGLDRTASGIFWGLTRSNKGLSLSAIDPTAILEKDATSITFAGLDGILHAGPENTAWVARTTDIGWSLVRTAVDLERVSDVESLIDVSTAERSVADFRLLSEHEVEVAAIVDQGHAFSMTRVSRQK